MLRRRGHLLERSRAENVSLSTKMTQNPEWVLKFCGHFLSLTSVSLSVKGRHCSEGPPVGLLSESFISERFI